MRWLKVSTVILALLSVTALLVMRMNYREKHSIESDEFSVYGIKNGIAIECGEEMNGISISLPAGIAMGDVISVSSDTNIAYLKMDSENIENDRVVNASIIAVSEGIADVYVRSAEGDKESLRYTVNVYSDSDAISELSVTGTFGTTENKDNDVLCVYITKYGTKYHLSKKCAGDTAQELTLADAVSNGYLPCKNCAVNK